MDWKKIGKWLLFPPIWFMIIMVLISIVMLPMVFIEGWQEDIIAYVIYVQAFYTLMVVAIFSAMVLPKRYQEIRQKIYDNPFGNRYMTEPEFRTHVSLNMSLGFSLLYVGVNVLSYILYHSWWFVVLAVYYMILAVMRFLLLRYVRGNVIGQNRLGELQRSKLCAIILLALNFTLSGSVLMILYQGKGFVYHGIIIYVMALYTFYHTVSAIINLVKYRKYHSPVMTTAKVIALSAALVSMLSLETAMLTQFGADMSPENKYLMVALTGAGVSIAVIAMAGYIITKSIKEIEKIRSSQNAESESQIESE